jgi:peptidylprolyl isomerase
MPKKILVFILVIIFGISSVTGCTGKEDWPLAKEGDIVQVHYKGTLQDGSIFDSSRGREPLEFILGGGDLIVGFDKAVRGMKVGEIKTVTIPVNEAYGPYVDGLVAVFKRENLPENLEPAVGQQLDVRQPDGTTVVVVVTDVSDVSITVDANHPLAGKDLTFEIELVEIK